jgi:hypothetical protein
MRASIYLIRNVWANACNCARTSPDAEIQPDKTKSPASFLAGLGYRIFRFFIVATALTPDELQRFHYQGEQ